MVKIRFIMYKIKTFFTIHETLFQNVIEVLPTTYQNETKMPEQNRIPGLIISYIKYTQVISV